MSRIVITNSDTTFVTSQPSQLKVSNTERQLRSYGDYFDYYVVEEYKEDSVAGYIGHKFTGAAFLFGSVIASPLLITGCTAEMDRVEPFVKVKGDQDAGIGDTTQPRGTDAGFDSAQDYSSTSDDDIIPADAGLDAIADSATDTDTSIDDGDAMSTPDDGFTPVDTKQDDATDTATDAGLDAVADGTTDADAPVDASPETDACTGKPMCVPGPGSVVKKDNNGKEYIEVSVNEGQTANVTFLMTGTNYDCTNPALPAAELPGTATPITVQYTEKQSTSFDDSCNVYLCSDGSLSAPCPPVKVNVNHAPIINKLKGPTGLGILPSGDQCFSATNAVQFTWDASDTDNDPLNCTINVTETSSGKVAATVAVTQAAGAAMLADIPANSLKARMDYCWNLSCSDGKSSAVIAGGNNCFTTSEKGLIGWWRFDEGQGDVIKDMSGNGVPDGKLTDFDLSVAWVKTPTGTGVFFDGVKNYINIPTPASWNNLNTLSAIVVFSNAFPLDQNAVLIDKMGDIPTNRWTFEFLPNKKVLFGTCSPTVKCELDNIIQSKTALVDSNWHTLTGIYTGNASSLYVDNALEGQLVYPNSGPLVTTNNLLFGKWTSGNRFYHGIIDEARFYNTDVSTQCK